MGNLVSLALCLLLCGCGSNLSQTFGKSKTGIPQPGDSKPTLPDNKLSGTVQLIDGTLLDLAQVAQPVVVIFVTYFCIPCKEESAHLADYFAIRAGLPTNALLITVLAGGSVEKAKVWGEKNRVSWSMASDPNGRVFVGLCSEKLTPCVLTQNLTSDPVINKHLGITGIDVLEKETGPWVF